jgi:CBS domain-containing protein
VLVKDLMKREVAPVGPDASVALAARIMRDQDVGCLPVLERERLIGMITDRDIVVRGVAEGLDSHRAIVREAMSVKAIACSVEHTVGTRARRHGANLIKHLSPAIKKDDVILAAVAKFAQDRGLTRWDEAADAYELKEGD